MFGINRPEVLNLSTLALGTAALVAPAILAPNAALAGIVTRDTLSTVPNPVYLSDTSTNTPPGEILNGVLAVITQTVQPGQSGLPATLKFDASVLALRPNGTWSTFARPRDFLPGGQFANNPLTLSVRWWEAALFNPNDLSQGLALSESVNRISGAPLTSGRDNNGNQTFVVTYQPTLPLSITAPTTYLLGFGMTTSTFTESLLVQWAIPRSGFITEASVDYILGNAGQGGLTAAFSPLSDNDGDGFYASYIELPAPIPEPASTGGLLALAGGALLSRQRRT